jgi:transposase
MARHRLTDEQWNLIVDLIPPPKSTGRPPSDRRMILDGILWILRTGSPWRDLPEEFGPWKTVWTVFDDWNRDGVLDRILSNLQQSVTLDSELWCIDGTNVRAARCAAGGGKKTNRRNRRTMRSGAAAGA